MQDDPVVRALTEVIEAFVQRGVIVALVGEGIHVRLATESEQKTVTTEGKVRGW